MTVGLHSNCENTSHVQANQDDGERGNKNQNSIIVTRQQPSLESIVNCIFDKNGEKYGLVLSNTSTNHSPKYYSHIFRTWTKMIGRLSQHHIIHLNSIDMKKKQSGWVILISKSPCSSIWCLSEWTRLLCFFKIKK